MSHYLIPIENVERFQAKLNKLIKVAAKLQVSPIVVTRAADVMVPVRDPKTGFETGEFSRKAAFTVEGTSPKFAGWSFAASLEPMAAGNLVRSVPGAADIPERYRTAAPACEHCNLLRKRKGYFVVAKDDGTFKSVGRSCLKDFLGHQDPERIATMMSLIISLEDEKESSGSGGRAAPTDFALEYVLTISLMYIRKFGFFSKKKMRELAEASGNYAGLTTTAEQVNYYLVPPYLGESLDNWNEEHRLNQPTEADKALAVDIRSWMLELGDKVDASEFDYNLSLLAKEGYAQTKHFGFIAAAANAGGRYLERLIIEKEAAAKKSNDFVGVVGVRSTYTLKITKMRSHESDYGETTMVLMEDEKGNAFQWWSSKGYDRLKDDGVREGDTYEVTATIKKHDLYKDRRQTGLTRCKFKLVPAGLLQGLPQDQLPD